MTFVPNLRTRRRGLLDEGGIEDVIADSVEVALVQHGVALGPLGSNYRISVDLDVAGRVNVELALPWWRRVFFEARPLEERARRILASIEAALRVPSLDVVVTVVAELRSSAGPDQ